MRSKTVAHDTFFFLLSRTRFLMDDPFLRAHDAHEMNHVDYDDISDLKRHNAR